MIQLNTLKKRLILSSPLDNIAYLRQQLGFFEHTIGKSLRDFIDKKKAELCFANDRLYSLNPLSILERGYSITRKIPDMVVIKGSRQVTAGDNVNVLLGRGEIDPFRGELHRSFCDGMGIHGFVPAGAFEIHGR